VSRRASEDGLAAIIDVMLATHLAPDRIRPMVESMKRRAPNSARSYILAARFAEYDDDAAAFEAAVTKAESLLAPGDWLSRRPAVRAACSRARMTSIPCSPARMKTPADLKRSLKWYMQAVELNKEDARPCGDSARCCAVSIAITSWQISR
jgi:hypothetical protein